MLYICISKTEDSPPNRGFLGFFLPRPAEKQARRGGHCRPDNFFQVPCSFFYLPDNFSQVPFSFAEAAGGLFPKVKNVKVEGLGRPDFPVGTHREQGRCNPKDRRLHGPGPDRTTRRRRSTKRPQRVKTRHFDVKMRFPLYKEAVIHKFYLYLPRKKILLWPKLNYYPCSPGC